MLASASLSHQCRSVCYPMLCSAFYLVPHSRSLAGPMCFGDDFSAHDPFLPSSRHLQTFVGWSTTVAGHSRTCERGTRHATKLVLCFSTTYILVLLHVSHLWGVAPGQKEGVASPACRAKPTTISSADSLRSLQTVSALPGRWSPSSTFSILRISRRDPILSTPPDPLPAASRDSTVTSPSIPGLRSISISVVCPGVVVHPFHLHVAPSYVVHSRISPREKTLPPEAGLFVLVLVEQQWVNLRLELKRFLVFQFEWE